MKTLIVVTGILVLIANSADARPKHRKAQKLPAVTSTIDQHAVLHTSQVTSTTYTLHTNSHLRKAPRQASTQLRSLPVTGNNTKPRAWCGWWMRQRHGGGPEYNLARNWLNRGNPVQAAMAQAGDIVVWARGRIGGHVGEITQVVNACTAVVISGNDGRAVRERPRNICGAIGIRRG